MTSSRRFSFGERFARDLRTPLRRFRGGKHFTPEDHPDVLAAEITSLTREAEQLAGPVP